VAGNVNGAAWRQHLDQRQQEYLTQLSELVAIPSVSALARRRVDVASAAEWVESKERKRVRRWLAEAVELRDGGYLRLLRGG